MSVIHLANYRTNRDKNLKVKLAAARFIRESYGRHCPSDEIRNAIVSANGLIDQGHDLRATIDLVDRYLSKFDGMTEKSDQKELAQRVIMCRLRDLPWTSIDAAICRAHRILDGGGTYEVAMRQALKPELRNWYFKWGDLNGFHEVRLHDKTEFEAKREAEHFGWSSKKWWQFWRDEYHYSY